MLLNKSRLLGTWSCSNVLWLASSWSFMFVWASSHLIVIISVTIQFPWWTVLHTSVWTLDPSFRIPQAICKSMTTIPPVSRIRFSPELKNFHQFSDNDSNYVIAWCASSVLSSGNIGGYPFAVWFKNYSPWSTLWRPLPLHFSSWLVFQADKKNIQYHSVWCVLHFWPLLHT